MIYYKNFEIPKFRPRLTEQGKYFYNEIFCFDIEVTSFFYSKHFKKWGTPFTIGLEECQEAEEAVGIPYIWQFNCNGTVVYGRYLTEFVEFLWALNRKNKYRKYIYVHFLAFEFHFLMSHIHFNQVFARKSHMPMYAYCDDYNCEFRCSYVLTNMGLAKLQENYNLSVTKKEGQLNYNIPRIPQTELTETELEYCEYDVIVMFELLKQFREKYKTIPNIPLTQTGEIRRVVKETVLNSPKHLNRISRMYPDLENYRILTRVFAGGYTHANYLYNGMLIHNIHSFDRASSYPAVMVTKKFPMSRFEKCENVYTRRNHYCYLSYISISNFQARGAWTYISQHKTEVRENCSVDNGRLVAGDYVEMWVTDVDYDIICQAYDGEINIIKNYRAFKEYLPKPFIEFILEQYVFKTTLKGNKAKKDLYAKAKQFINALFGMCVTNDIRDNIEFKNDTLEWKLSRLNDNDICNKLDKDHFLNFAWGIFVTAYARAELWKLIFAIGDDVVYCDTDSVKFMDLTKNLHYITEYNNCMIDEIQQTAECLNIPLEQFMPKLTNKKLGMCSMPIGVFEYECTYSDFKTYGAKKYAYNYAHNGEFNFTVAGCIKKYYDWNEIDPKKVVKPTIKSLDEFYLGKQFLHGRRIMKYISNQPLVELSDLQGNSCVNYQTTGIVSFESTYTLGLSGDYYMFLATYNSTSTHNKYSSPYRCFF